MKLFGILSGNLAAVLTAVALMMCLLVLSELPHNDDVEGRYINLLLAAAPSKPHESHEPHEMSAISPFSITEERIISVLYVAGVLFSCGAILSGLFIDRREKSARTYAAPVALSVILLVVLFHYRWVFAW